MSIISYYSRNGAYHSERNMENEDRYAVLDGQDFLVLAVADGVSTCIRSGIGAQIAADTVIRMFKESGGLLWNLEERNLRKVVYREILFALRRRAGEDGLPVGEYSSTIAFAVFSKKTRELLLFSLGDSTILTYGKNGYRIAAAPCAGERTETVTTTTEGGENAIFVSRQPAVFGSVFLFTDGGWEIAGKLLRQPERLGETEFCDLVRNTMITETGTDDSTYIAAVMEEVRKS